MSLKRCVVLCAFLLCLLMPMRGYAVVATGPGATGITGAAGWLDESRILAVMGKGALGNCFLTSVRFTGVDVCSNGIWPRVCVRMRNNIPTNLMEASGKRQHLALLTVLGEVFLDAWVADNFAMPTNKKIGQDSGDGGKSASGRVHARVLGTPLLVDAVFKLLSAATLDTICKSTSLPIGYAYFAEGDEVGGATSMWRAIISPYYLNKMTSGISAWAKATELFGTCRYDVNYMLCLGGYGTKYPTAADVGSGSPAIRLITGMWRAQEITAMPFGVYGPYDTSLGIAIHGQLHMPTAIAGTLLNSPPAYSPGSYTQFLYPGVGGAPVGAPDMWCTILGVGHGTSPQVLNQMLSESINRTFADEDTLAFAYWARFTCCNWCIGSDQENGLHMIPEKGFRSVLTRVP